MQAAVQVRGVPKLRGQESGDFPEEEVVVRATKEIAKQNDNRV